MNDIRPCGNNEKWCESCVSKGKCNYTKKQDIIAELEKIKAEIGKCSDYVITNHNNTEADMNKLDGIILAITIIDTEITELEGENNE